VGKLGGGKLDLGKVGLGKLGFGIARWLCTQAVYNLGRGSHSTDVENNVWLVSCVACTRIVEQEI